MWTNHIYITRKRQCFITLLYIFAKSKEAFKTFKGQWKCEKTVSSVWYIFSFIRFIHKTKSGHIKNNHWAPSKLRRRNLPKKRSCNYPVRPTRSTIIRTENGACRRQRSLNSNLETSALWFSMKGKHFGNEVFFENDSVTIIRRFHFWVFLKHKYKMTGGCWVIKFLPV